MAFDAPLGLNNPRVSRTWRIRHPSAIIREIPPRSVRSYNNHRLAAAANCEHFFVVAPAVVDDKQRPSFETLWAQANSDFLF